MVIVEKLTLEYSNGTKAIKNISFSIPKGKLVLICGPNGSGKSSLLKVLAGLHHPTKGRVLLEGKDLHSEIRDPRKLAGLVFQNPEHQILGETVEEDVALGPRYLGLPQDEIQKRVNEALSFCNLSHMNRKNCHLLSGGEKKRLSIASVLAMKPQIILLDEPFANLDFPAAKSILRCILSMRTQGYTIVVASHEVEMLAPHIDKILVLYGGELKMESNTPETIYSSLASYGVRPPCYAIFGTKPPEWLAI
ncbi:MAG TPA: ABC transporter ATP-binding protein [Thermodesulforhabdus norvegica]|uniref:ABC transporter ATP-binding protein n=1 Tax=Thermodesulforhabdus norvegica TaxID=39841 RepID=A0A7C0WUI7_9BACT|nr:ABC transporter ATP-binding protein [Deltaproteobacteria bacterium]MBW2068061.1 ABC transporter ATP-binding protein [Deltaproteobacteria bacterium]HDL89992.1 ABC transporter ATP-binding protein [Thermodesulforhabdus norvegica]